MNLDSPEIKLLCELAPGSSTFQINNINIITDGFESREGNLIELFESAFRYRKKTTQNELNKLEKLSKQIQNQETERQRRENDIIFRYESNRPNEEQTRK